MPIKSLAEGSIKLQALAEKIFHGDLNTKYDAW